MISDVDECKDADHRQREALSRCAHKDCLDGTVSTGPYCVFQPLFGFPTNSFCPTGSQPKLASESHKKNPTINFKEMLPIFCHRKVSLKSWRRRFSIEHNLDEKKPWNPGFWVCCALILVDLWYNR